MAKRSFYVKDSELDDYQVKVINKKTDNSYIVKDVLEVVSLFWLFGRPNKYRMNIKVHFFISFSRKH